MIMCLKKLKNALLLIINMAPKNVYKILDIEYNENGYPVAIKVQVSGMRLFLKFSIEEVFSNPEIIHGFSSRDMASIIAMEYDIKKNPVYCLNKIECFIENGNIKQIFNILNRKNGNIKKMTVSELINDDEILANLKSNDLVKLGYQLAVEQSFEFDESLLGSNVFYLEQ